MILAGREKVEGIVDEGGPTYWPGYDAVEIQIATIRAELDQPRKRGVDDGWVRHKIQTTMLWPLESILMDRHVGDHNVYMTVWRAGSDVPARYCTCELVVPATDVPWGAPGVGDRIIRNGQWPPGTAERAQAEMAFLDAPGHLDWSIRPTQLS